jgi:hypothetical protein
MQARNSSALLKSVRKPGKRASRQTQLLAAAAGLAVLFLVTIELHAVRSYNSSRRAVLQKKAVAGALKSRDLRGGLARAMKPTNSLSYKSSAKMAGFSTYEVVDTTLPGSSNSEDVAEDGTDRSNALPTVVVSRQFESPEHTEPPVVQPLSGLEKQQHTGVLERPGDALQEATGTGLSGSVESEAFIFSGDLPENSAGGVQRVARPQSNPRSRANDAVAKAKEAKAKASKTAKQIARFPH